MAVINIVSMKATKLIAIGWIIAANPSTSNILNIFEPITFPIAISVSPFLTAITEVTNSGSDVPIATIVRPTKLALIPKEVAILDAESTTKSPPYTIPIIPTRQINKVLGIDTDLESESGISMAMAVSPLETSLLF